MPKILIVEDNPTNRDMLSRRLERKGYEIVMAFDGAQGVEMAHSERPTLILMDMSLPVMDGWEATRRLKSDVTTKHIPIIALTAHAMSGDREKCIEAGCDDYDTKPVDLARLLEKMEALMVAPEPEPEPEAEPEASNDFFTQMAHEIRTPLNQIIGYSEMLAEEAEDLQQAGFTADLQRIEVAGKQILTLIDDLFAPERIAALQSQLKPQPISSALSVERLMLLPFAPQEKKTQGAILVVDDTPVNCDVLCQRLERQGHLTAIAHNGRQALELLKTKPFDLVLLDIMMPDMDGYQVLEQIKTDAKLRHIPVIMISALDEIDSIVRCVELGAEDYLHKPFDPTLLKARIGACLEKKGLHDQEMLYLQQVERLTTAAAEVEAKTFDPDSLADLARRTDKLGQLARVFQRMACEVNAREHRLKQQVQALQVAIDDAKKQRMVAEIAETDHFRQLQKRAKAYQEG